MNVPLSEPAVKDGKAVQEIDLQKPRTRHIKKLALLLGPEFFADLIDAVGGRGEADLSEANKLEIAKTALAKLLKPETLDGLTELLADMAGLDVGTVDDMPPADTFKLAEEAIGFFSEALSSLGGGE